MSEQTKDDDDPGLDVLSDVWVMDKHGKLIELTWRQVGDYCVNEMKLYDSIGNQLRLKNQVANDPNYKPIEPMAGLKKWRKWRG